MKPFNLEAAKAGAPVQTTSGLPVRLFCFDRLGSKQTIVGLVQHTDDTEFLHTWAITGKKVCTPHPHPCDLAMAPVKKTGWVNIYANQPYDSYEAARKVSTFGCVATVQVEWEE